MHTVYMKERGMIIGALLVVLFALVVNLVVRNDGESTSAVTFEECVQKGNAVMESYPRQCRDGAGVLHVEEVALSEVLKEQEPTFTYEEALERAEGSMVCTSEGDVGELIQFDATEGEWWFVLRETKRPYCEPVCAVRDPDGGVRVDWRCP
jgi:hypothetical protein